MPRQAVLILNLALIATGILIGLVKYGDPNAFWALMALSFILAGAINLITHRKNLTNGPRK